MIDNALLSTTFTSAKPMANGDAPTSCSALGKEPTRVLQQIHTQFASRLEQTLCDIVSSPNVSLVALQETTAARHRQTHGSPWCAIHFSAAQPMAGALECSRSLALHLVDQMLQCGGEYSTAGRPLSEIEMQLLRDAIRPVLPSYIALWNRFLPMQIHVEQNDDDFRPSEELYVATYEVRTPQGTHQLHLALRLAAWRESLAVIGAAAKSSHRLESLHSGLLNTIGDFPLPVRAILGRTRVSVQDLLSMREGDIICLDRDPNAPLELSVGNRPKLEGHAQVENGHYVITVDRLLTRGKV